MNAPRRAALLLRVSTEEQNRENQRPALEQLARVRGLEIVLTYEATVSGAKEDRAELTAMLAAAHAGKFDVLLMWALDRLGRNMFEVIAAVRKLDAAGVRVVSIQESWLDTGGPARDLLLAIFAWVAQYERDRLIERTRAGMERARRDGKAIGRPRKTIRTSSAKSLQDQGLSIRAIAKQLQVKPSTLQRALAGERAGKTG